MRNAELGRILRRVLSLSLAASGPVAACGGAVQRETSDAGRVNQDAATADLDGTMDPDAETALPDANRTLDAGSDSACDQGSLPDGDVCTTYVALPCESQLDSGPLDPATCQIYCKASPGGCSIATVNGTQAVLCSNCYLGRRPPNLVLEGRPEAATLLGDWFARCAELEAASVEAFRVMGIELAAHGAPSALRAAAEKARSDEVRHARMNARVAARLGAAPRPATASRIRVRSLEAVAIENAIEGCVRETYGALAAMWQARTARDPAIARMMERIARDEVRHAALAWRVAGWANRKLDAGAHGRVRKAMRRAVAALRRDLANEPPADVRTLTGLPMPCDALTLCDQLDAALWGMLPRKRRAGALGAKAARLS
jgi:hypothetical protein